MCVHNFTGRKLRNIPKFRLSEPIIMFLAILEKHNLAQMLRVQRAVVVISWNFSIFSLVIPRSSTIVTGIL